MIIRRDTGLATGAALPLHPHVGTRNAQTMRVFALAAAGLVVVALGVNHAQTAQAATNLAQAKQVAVAEVGSRVGVGAAGIDVAAIRVAAASQLAGAAVSQAQGLVVEAGAALGAARVAGLASARDEVLSLLRFGAGVSTLAAATDALQAEQQSTSTALSEFRVAEAARVAAEAAAAEAARAAGAAAAPAASVDSADVAESWSESTDVAAAAEAAPAAAENPYTAEFYPGLPPAPRAEDCGPCNGKDMYPVLYNGSYTWGCSA